MFTQCIYCKICLAFYSDFLDLAHWMNCLRVGYSGLVSPDMAWDCWERVTTETRIVK